MVMIKDLHNRTFKFAVDVVRLIKSVPSTKENDVIRYQLAKSGTSIGANYEEAQAAFSKDDFTYKMSICLREARESNYWLRLIKETEIVNKFPLDLLIQESHEIKNIFGSIVAKKRLSSNWE